MRTVVAAAAAPRFEVPAGRLAAAPADAHGLARDEVRLLVASSDSTEHAHFRDLPRFLAPGDLLVVNTSATLPAAVDGALHGGRPVAVHFSSPLRDPVWVVELRTRGGAEPVMDAAAGDVIRLPGDVRVVLVRPQQSSVSGSGHRLWQAATVRVDGPVESYLHRYGRPISYGYVHDRWPLSYYQTVFALEPGSAEMPSAGRPFTTRLVTELVARGVVIAPVVLHAGVSSLDSGETPQPERFHVSSTTARLANETRAAGGRVVAVGTTAMRALESVAHSDGTVRSGEGWTDLVLGPTRQARVVDSLITGWHTQESSHLTLLHALVGPQVVQSAYDEALRAGYLWHEFGDTCLLLAPRRSQAVAAA